MILWDFVPPVKQDTIYTKHVYQYSKRYVEVGSCFKDRGTMLQRQKPKMWLFDLSCVTWIVVFFDSFFVLFWMETDKFLSFFLTVIYICKDLSIPISFSQFSVFS